MLHHLPLRSSIGVILLCLLAGGRALAGDSTVAVPDKTVVAPAPEKTWCEQLWEYPTIYKNDESSFFNEFRFVGRAHFDEYMINSDEPSNYDQDWIVRRIRFGAKMRFFKHLDVHGEVDWNLQNPRPAYARLTDAYIAWTFSDAAKLTVGKQSAKFTLDGGTSSNELITIDRNNVANNLWFTTEYISGVTLGGKYKGLVYNAGVFSGGTETKEFGDFDAGTFELFNLGYDFGKLLGVKKALIRADYVHNEPDAQSTATRPFEHIGALVFQLDTDKWGFWGEFAAGQGFDNVQSDLWGFTAMPYYNITKNIQAVFRYNYLTSDDPRGVRLNRYDNVVSSRRGDEYHEFYGGLNYYICGHRLKVQTGVSYVTLNDSSLERAEYHAWQWTTGLRLSF